MSHPVDDDTRATATERGFRASDADRQLTVMVLQEAVSRGLLTPAEGSERMAAAWAATHHGELPPLTADLPPAEPTVTSRSRRARPGRDRQHRPRTAGRSGTDWRSRGLALWGTVLGALTAMIAMIGGDGRHRRLRLGVAAVVAVLVLVAVVSISGHAFTDGDFPRGGGRMAGDPGSPR